MSSHQFAWVFLVGLIGLLLTETSMAITSSKSQSVPATFVYSDVDTTAQLMGRVLNEDGIAVVGANIRLNEYVGTYTDSSGLYIIKGIESGEYKLQISHIGYVEYQRTLEFIPKDKVFIEVRLESKPYENGTIVVTASRTQEALSPLAVLIVPLVDFSLAVGRRLRRGMSPFDADRAHLHHRLLDMGHSHRQAVLILYSWTAVLAIGTLMFLFVAWYVAVGIIVVGLIGSTVVTLSPDNRAPNDPLAVEEGTPS